MINLSQCTIDDLIDLYYLVQHDYCGRVSLCMQQILCYVVKLRRSW